MSASNPQEVAGNATDAAASPPQPMGFRALARANFEAAKKKAAEAKEAAQQKYAEAQEKGASAMFAEAKESAEQKAAAAREAALQKYSEAKEAAQQKYAETQEKGASAMFAEAKESAEQKAAAAREAASQKYSEAKEAAQQKYAEAQEKAPVMFAEAKESAGQKAAAAREAASQKYSEAKEAAQQKYAEAQEKAPVMFAEAKESAGQKAAAAREAASQKYSEAREAVGRRWGSHADPAKLDPPPGGAALPATAAIVGAGAVAAVAVGAAAAGHRTEREADVPPQGASSVNPTGAPPQEISEEEIERRVQERLERRLQEALHEKRSLAGVATVATSPAPRAIDDKQQASSPAPPSSDDEGDEATHAVIARAEFDRRVQEEVARQLELERSQPAHAASSRPVRGSGFGQEFQAPPLAKTRRKKVPGGVSYSSSSDESSSEEGSDGEAAAPSGEPAGIDRVPGTIHQYPEYLSQGVFSDDAPELAVDITTRFALSEFDAALREEREAASSGIAALDGQPFIAVEKYETKREEGRCVGPSPPELSRLSIRSHLAVQLGYLSSKQTIVQPAASMKVPLVEREPLPGGRERLSDLKPDFEDNHPDRESETSDTRESHGATRATGDALLNVATMAAAPGDACDALFRRISFPDPIQMWGKVCGKLPPTVKSGTTPKVWCYDYEPRKPLPAPPMFTNGILYEVTVNEITSALHQKHGADIDPLFGTIAIYSVDLGSKRKVSETFYFDFASQEFFPGRQRLPSQSHKSFVAFLPNELSGTPLFLVVRLFRLLSDEGMSNSKIIDLYLRGEKVNAKEAQRLRESMLNVSKYSNSVQEVCFAVLCFYNPRSPKLLRGDIVLDNFHLLQHSMSDSSIMQLVLADRVRTQMKVVPIKLTVHLRDASKDEVSVPHQGFSALPTEEESVLGILPGDVKGATKKLVRNCPCVLPILNAGPYNAYTNVMYVRLHKLNFAKVTLPKPLGQRTFIVQISLKESDETPEETGLPCVYGRTLAESIVTVTGFSTGTWHQKDVEFPDEFKLQLPLVLTERHHILFTIYYVAFQPLDGAQRWYKVGHAVLPVFANGAILARDPIPLSVTPSDAFRGLCPGYLGRLAQLAPSSFYSNGDPIFTVSTCARSTVYGTNATLSNVFAKSGEFLKELTKETDSRSEEVRVPRVTQLIDVSVLQQIAELPLPETVAFYPMIASVLLATVASPCKAVGLDARTKAFRILMEHTTKVHQWEVSLRTNVQEAGKTPGGKPLPKKFVITTPLSYLYHYFSNHVLFDDVKFTVGEAVAEICVQEIRAIAASREKRLETAIAELFWFIFDLVARSLYLQARGRDPVAVREGFPPGFYTLMDDLVKEATKNLIPVGVGSFPSRLALFVRHLLGFCNRAKMLEILKDLLTHLQRPGMSAYLISAIRIMFDADLAVLYSLPSIAIGQPRFLLEVCLTPLLSLLIWKDKVDAPAVGSRSACLAVLSNFIMSVVYNPKLRSEDLAAVGQSLFVVVSSAAENWKQIAADWPTAERRQLLTMIVWILHWQLPSTLRQRLLALRAADNDGSVACGFLTLVANAVSTFATVSPSEVTSNSSLQRAGSNQRETSPKTQTAAEEEISMQHRARYSTLVSFLAVKIGDCALEGYFEELKTVRSEQPAAIVDAFFGLLAACCGLQNSFPALQAGAALLNKCVYLLSPELLSYKARMAPLLAQLLVQLMGCTSAAVRSLAGHTFLCFARRYRDFFGSLKNLNRLVAAAFVRHGRSDRQSLEDLRKPGRLAERELQRLCEAAATPAEQVGQAAGGELLVRFSRDAAGANVKAAEEEEDPQGIPAAILTVVVPPPKVDAAPPIDPQPFGTEFIELAHVISDLFGDVLQVQSTTPTESKTVSFRKIAARFLEQRSVVDAVRWLQRMQDVHKATGNFVEAGMASVYMAGLGFRATEVFYALDEEKTKRAPLPREFFMHVFFHDYLRLLPELAELSGPAMQAAFADLPALPAHPVFTLQGQIDLMKDAAECFGRAQYFELSMLAIRIVDAIIFAQDDWISLGIVHTAMAKWANGIENAGSAPRMHCRYFVLRAEGPPLVEPIHRIFKASPGMSSSQFKSVGQKYVMSAIGGQKITLAEEPIEVLKREMSAKLKKSGAGKGTTGGSALTSCIAEVLEVIPHTEADQRTPQQPQSVLHRACYHSQFYNATRVHEDNGRFIVDDGLVSAISGSLPASQIDVAKHNMKLVVFKVSPAFPSLTTSVPVVSMERTICNAVETAMMTIDGAFEALSEVNMKTAGAILGIQDVLCPVGVRPPGTMFKNIVATFPHEPDVLRGIRNFLSAISPKIKACEAAGVTVELSDVLATCQKALVDIACALTLANEVVYGSTSS